MQWISAIQLAINNSGGNESYQRIQAMRRRAQRIAGTLKIEEEVLRQNSQIREMESTKQKLKEEIEVILILLELKMLKKKRKFSLGLLFFRLE